jgi:3-hydroxyacyl-CoA dehydrogenase/3a,7a,12a-trihydroxy-5b-cholest-24-enoyl-CoA hydratase
VDFSANPPSITGGDSAKAASKLSMDDADLAALARGQANARDLFQHGKLRVDGDIAPAHKLDFLNGLL